MPSNIVRDALEQARLKPQVEIVRALQALWLIAYRHMPNDRHTLDAIGSLLDVLLERYLDDC